MPAGRAGWEFQDACAQENSGQKIHPHPFNTQILLDPFIIVVVDITSLCVGNFSSLACMALHPPCNATPLLYLGDSQALVEVRLSYHLWPGRWWCVKWCLLLQEIMLWHWAALEGESLEWESFFPLSEGIKLQLFCSGWLLDAIQDFCFTRDEMLNSSLLEGIYFERFSLQILFYCPAIPHLWCSQNLV